MGSASSDQYEPLLLGLRSRPDLSSVAAEEVLSHRPVAARLWLRLRLVGWESRLLWKLSAASIIAVSIFNYTLSSVTLTFAGYLGPLELAGASIASIGIQGLAYGLMLEMASAVQTVCGQAYGAKRYASMCVACQQAMILHTGAAIPLTFLYWFSSDVLRFCRTEEQVTDIFIKDLLSDKFEIFRQILEIATCCIKELC